MTILQDARIAVSLWMAGNRKTIHCKFSSKFHLSLLTRASDEHQRRAPDCKFFSLIATTKPKAGRPRKSRGSKVSRLSTQSIFTVISEASIAEPEAMENHSGILFADEIEQPIKTGRGRKKAAKAKKTSAKSKPKATKTKVEEAPQASSFIEPEDDNFEVKVDTTSSKNVKSKKRSSDEMNDDLETQQSDLRTHDVYSQPSLVKRRMTRSRSSVMQINNVSTLSLQNEYETDTLMADAESAVPPAAPVSKKGTKRGKKRASSTVRKASVRSIASVAPLRGVPDDDAIDAALEAGLDRPLSDDETIAEQSELPQPKSRRLTRTKPTLRNGVTSTASIRRNTRKDNISHEKLEVEKQETEMQDITKSANVKPNNIEEKFGFSSPMPNQDVTNESILPGALPVHEISLDHPRDERMHISISPSECITDSVPIKHKALKSRQPSRHVGKRSTRASVVTTSDDVLSLRSDLSSSIALSHADKNEYEPEAPVSIVIQGPRKRKGNKGIGVVKKGKLSKKALAVSRNIEDVIQPTIENILSGEPEDASHIETSFLNSGPRQDTLQDENNVMELAISRSPVATPILFSPRQSAPNAEETEATSPAIPASGSRVIKEFSRPLPSSPTKDARMKTPPPAQPPAEPSVQLSETQVTPRIAVSPQSSDVENQPPSSRPSATRPPILADLPSLTQPIRIPLASTTPTSSPFKQNTSRLQSSVPWVAIEFESLFLGSPVEKENNPFTSRDIAEGLEAELGSPEKKLSVEEWVQFNAKKGEVRLRNECERLVRRFEGEGIRALRTLEGIACVD